MATGGSRHLVRVVVVGLLALTAIDPTTADAPKSTGSPSPTPPTLPSEDAQMQEKKRLAGPTVYEMDRPHFSVMEGSHERFTASNDLADKVPPTAKEYAHLLRDEEPLVVQVFTEGEYRSTQHPAGEFLGFRMTDEERAALEQIGEIKFESEIYPSLELLVPSGSDVQRVASLPEVYAIIPPVPLERISLACPDPDDSHRMQIDGLDCANRSDAYSRSWIQGKQKIDQTWA